MGVVPHVQHLVVLAHIRDSMTTSVLRSSGGGGTRPPDGASAARRPPILEEKPQFHYKLTLGSPPWKRRGRGKTGENRSQFVVNMNLSRIIVYLICAPYPTL